MAKKYCPNHPDRRLWAGGVCLECYRRANAKPLKRTRIKPISQKQKNTLTLYRLLRRKKLRENPTCEIGLAGCTVVSTEIHHTAKKYTRELWLNLKKMKAVCRNCHTKIENSPAMAKALGIYNYKIKDDEDILNLFDDGPEPCP